MMKDRLLFAERVDNISVPTNLINALSKDGLGQKHKKYAIYKNSMNIIPDFEKSNPKKVAPVGAGWFQVIYQKILVTIMTFLLLLGGFGVFLTSASSEWPLFEHLLPEIAFAGHSNVGKVSYTVQVSCMRFSVLP